MSSNSKTIVGVVIVIIVAVVLYGVLTMPDRRNGAEKLGDAIHELPQGPDKAARQLEDRTPGQKLGDAIKDTGDSVKKETAAP